jgi:hypothetical protein
LFADEVRMWVFEETLPTGEKLSESINQAHVRAELVPFLVCFTLEQVVPCTIVIIFCSYRVSGELQILARYKAWN